MRKDLVEFHAFIIGEESLEEVMRQTDIVVIEYE